MNKVLVMKNVKKDYFLGKKKIEVLKGVELEVEEGESVAITGVSGVGKTTLLYLAGGIERPSEGKIFLDGQEITALNENELARIRGEKVSYVFQFFHLLPDFTALENVLLPLLIRRIPWEKSANIAERILREMGLGDRKEHLPSELSGGEQQRVGIARALVLNPKVILADEPTGNLDPGTAEMVFQVLVSKTKEKGCALILATHNMFFAEKMDRVMRIEDGRLVEMK